MKSNEFKNDFLKLIKNNPNLDVVCMCATDELTDEFRYLYLSKLSCSICYIYEYEDRIFLDKDEMTEYLCDIHDGDAEYLILVKNFHIFHIQTMI